MKPASNAPPRGHAADDDLGGSEPAAQAAMKQQSKTGHERGR